MIAPTPRQTLLLFLAGVAAVFFAALLVFGGLVPTFKKKPFSLSDFGPPHFEFRRVGFGDLEGWLQDDPAPAFEAFLKSCEKIDAMGDDDRINPSENLGPDFAGVTLSGVAADWRVICAEARLMSANSYTDPSSRRSSLRHFFEFQFRPVQIVARRDPLPDGPARKAPPLIEETGVFTGYYEPSYSASHVKTQVFSAPVYGRPNDLIDVDLGAFRDDLAGERIAGRVDGGKLVPYPDHRAINEGAIKGKAVPIAWMAPNDLFFLQIQGSGQLLFSDGVRMRVGYAGQNGRPYTAVGRIMVEQNIMPVEDVSMQTIRQWLDKAAPGAARAMREENASYVFFRSLDGLEDGAGPLGAQGVPLTTERSLAVDLRYHALGAPIWVDIDPVEWRGPRRIQQLMIAQDTGGAIKGPLRADVFWGAGERAAVIAGAMNAQGRMYVLVPRTLAERLPVAPREP